MKKTTEKTYEFVLKNLQDAPLALSRSILPVGMTGKVVFKDLNQVKMAHQLETKGSVLVVQGWTNELRQALNLETLSAPITVEEVIAGKVETTPLVQEIEPENNDQMTLEEFIEPTMTLEQIEAMTKEEMMELARKIPSLDIGKRTPFDVAQARVKAHFGYTVE